MPESIQIRNPDFSIRTWYLEESEEELKKGLELNPTEEMKLNFISNLKKRCIFLATRKLAIADTIDLIHYTNTGKPFTNNRKISISHSGNWICLMTSEKKEIGIDIEYPHERIHKIKDRFLDEIEKNDICHNTTFLMTLAWGVKEAVFKKYGCKTVFFKENIKLCEINSEQNSVLVKCRIENSFVDQQLKFEILSDGYILVYTL